MHQSESNLRLNKQDESGQEVRLPGPVAEWLTSRLISLRFFYDETGEDCGILLISVRMRAPLPQL